MTNQAIGKNIRRLVSILESGPKTAAEIEQAMPNMQARSYCARAVRYGLVTYQGQSHCKNRVYRLVEGYQQMIEESGKKATEAYLAKKAKSQVVKVKTIVPRAVPRSVPRGPNSIFQLGAML